MYELGNHVLMGEQAANAALAVIPIGFLILRILFKEWFLRLGWQA